MTGDILNGQSPGLFTPPRLRISKGYDLLPSSGICG
uniref:Uncharacterized protein n=1 Tax=Erwinia amylovora ATCC BAA-2158 TaxID=889211 RepID=E5B8X0_ERWAM|nr:hypothetical protein predicted by Glimmer/Critica [Erwinia amylovora ATCC BAA-2158]